MRLAHALALLTLAEIAWAQGADHKAAAEALFSEGRRLMDEGRYAEACKKLEASQKLDPGAGTLLNLAACYEQNGQTASAWVTYKEAAVASQARHADWAQQANARATALEPELARLTIEVPKPTPGIVVRRDGIAIEASAFGVAIPVDPGAHVVEAFAPEHRSFKAEIKVAAKATQSVTVPVLIKGDVVRPDEGQGAGQRIAGVVMISGGALGVLAGAIFGGLAFGKKGEAQPLCAADFKVCSPAGKAAVDDAKTMGTASTVAMIAGGALAASGLVVFLLAPRAKIEARAGAQGALLGLTLGGSF